MHFSRNVLLRRPVFACAGNGHRACVGAADVAAVCCNSRTGTKTQIQNLEECCVNEAISLGDMAKRVREHAQRRKTLKLCEMSTRALGAGDTVPIQAPPICAAQRRSPTVEPIAAGVEKKFPIDVRRNSHASWEWEDLFFGWSRCVEEHLRESWTFYLRFPMYFRVRNARITRTTTSSTSLRLITVPITFAHLLRMRLARHPTILC